MKKFLAVLTAFLLMLSPFAGLTEDAYVQDAEQPVVEEPVEVAPAEPAVEEEPEAPAEPAPEEPVEPEELPAEPVEEPAEPVEPQEPAEPEEPTEEPEDSADEPEVEETPAISLSEIVAAYADLGDYKKALALHDWLCNNPELLIEAGLCADIAQAYQLLLAEAGIESLYVEGSANGQAHVWNMIQLDGEWYHVDVAWNANEGDRFYFGLSNELISRDHVIEVAVPEADANDYNYAMQKTDGAFASVEELGGLLESSSKAELTFYYTGSDVIDAELTEWAQENAAAYALTGLSCTSADYTRFVMVSRAVETPEVPEEPVVTPEPTVEPTEQPEANEDLAEKGEGATLVLESVTPSATVLKPGEEITWTSVTSGGNGAIQYNYTIFKDGASYASLGWNASNTLTYTLPEEGTYKLQVRAKDADEVRSAYVTSQNTIVSAGSGTPELLRAIGNVTGTTLGNELVWTVTNTEGKGVGDLQYHFVILRNNVSYEILGWNNTNICKYTPTEEGTYKLQVRAKDELEQRSNYVWSAGLVVVESADPLVLNSVTPSEVYALPGTEITWTSKASGGIGNVEYNYLLLKDNVTYENIGWNASNKVTRTLTEEGIYKLQVRARDAAGARSEYVTSQTTMIAETVDPLVLKSVKPSGTLVTPGTEVTWTSAVEGGVGGNQYNYVLLKDNQTYKSYGWLSSSKLTVKLEEAGTYKLQVRAKDAAETRSEYVYSTTVIVSDVTAAPALLRAIPDVTATTLGNKIVWTVTKEDGKGVGALQYHYVILKENVTYEIVGWKDSNVLEFEPTEVGTYKLQVRAKDSAEQRSNYVWSAGILIVETAEPLVLNAVEVSATNVQPGTEVVWTPKTTGGIGTLQYNYTLLKDNASYATSGWVKDSTYKAELTELGNYKLQVRVKDAAEARSEYVISAVTTVADALVYGDFAYEVNSDNTGVIITAYQGSDAIVVVPDTINDLPVVEIGDEAFYNNTTITKVSLPDTVEVIGVRAFAGCTNLSEMD